MRNYHFPLAAVLALLIACSSQAAEKPRPAQGNQNQPKKVWTNDDMDQLRARGLISIVGQETTEPAVQAPVAATAETTFPVYESRFVQSQLDELSDLARQHDIPPGVLRG